MVDKLKFLNAKITVLGESYERDGIGTLSERSLHRILKSFYEPSEEFHEVEFLGSIADIKNSGGIIEIQTRAFERLVPKLRKFLPVIPVTVVLPLEREKTLRWIDTLTGEISTPRKSPKKETLYSSFRELYKIREFIPSSNLTVKLVFLSVEEYKYLNAKGGN